MLSFPLVPVRVSVPLASPAVTAKRQRFSSDSNMSGDSVNERVTATLHRARDGGVAKLGRVKRAAPSPLKRGSSPARASRASPSLRAKKSGPADRWLDAAG